MLQHVALAPDGEILEVGSSKRAFDAAAATGARVMVEEAPAEGRRVYENPGPGDTKSALVALKTAGLRPIDAREVEDMSLEEAYERIAPYFEKLRWVEKGVKYVGTGPAEQGPDALAESLLTENYKIAKRIHGMEKTVVMGLSLLPHALVTEVLKDKRWSEYKNDLPTLPKNFSPLGFCIGSNDMCRRSCLTYAGHNWSVFYNAKLKTAKTLALLNEPVAFVRMLLESCLGVAASQAAYHFIRLNVLSDIP